MTTTTATPDPDCVRAWVARVAAARLALADIARREREGLAIGAADRADRERLGPLAAETLGEFLCRRGVDA